MKLDKLDMDILKSLDMDARQSYSEISKKVGKSKQLVAYHVKNLEKNNIIQSYSLRANSRNLGFFHFGVFLKFQEMDYSEEKEIFENIKNSGHVAYCAKTMGIWDIFFGVVVKKPSELMAFLEDIHNICRHKIKDEAINIEIRDMEFGLNFLSKGKVGNYHITHEERDESVSELTDMELKVFKEIEKKPLISFLKIADNIGKSYSSVKKSFQKLKDKGVIFGCRANISLMNVGYEKYMLLIETHSSNKERLNEFIKYIQGNPNISYLIESAGKYKFVIDVYVKNIDELRFVDLEIKSKFNDLVSSIYSLRILEKEKEISLGIN